MKAAFVTDLKKVEIKDIPVPEISEDQVLIKTHTAGVCGSDLHLFLGTHPFRKAPAILGHEITGEIVKTGAEVSNLKVGDRVTVEPQLGCGHCHFCHDGNENLCLSKQVPGTPNWIGTFAEYFPAPASKVYKLADNVSYETGTLIEPLAVAVHAMHRVDIGTKGRSLLILGSGTIGLLALAVAKAQGYNLIICTDTAAYNREMALKFGADYAFDPLVDDIPAKVKEINGGTGVDVSLVCAGAPNIIDQASSSTRKLGVVGVVAMITKNIPVYTYGFVFNEQKLIGSMTYAPKYFAEAVELVNNGLNLKEYVTQEFSLDEAQAALSCLAEKKENVIKVIVKP